LVIAALDCRAALAMTDYPHGMQKEKPDGWVAITAGLLLDTQNGLGAVSNRIE
jgi:hypothetical protein